MPGPPGTSGSLGVRSIGGSPWWFRAGPGNQGPSHPQPGAEEMGGKQSSPGHQAPPRGQVSPAQQVPGWAGLWAAGDQPCYGVAGAGADGPGGWHRVLGPGQGVGAPVGTGKGQSGLVVPSGTQHAPCNTGAA